MEGREIRETFLRFFEERGHTRVKSASLIPASETGLLLTNAGMNQFIPYFLGLAPAPFPRAVTAQKCFRAVDIDNVGHTARHLTMFEMLGNFSFGDYFKAESCAWGFELVTEVFGIDPSRLWVTVFETDDEAIEVWADVGIPRERIVRRGKEDNFWWTHAAGPGGPCSEIYVDRGARFGPDGGPAADEVRFMEIWNHVFMQNEMDERGEVIGDLPKRNIDTGASVERIATVLDDADSFFDTDLMRPLVGVTERLSGKRYGADERDDISLRIVAEHGRATTFLIADGVQPSNEGRGYVLRRMLRRVVSHARRLGIEGGVMKELVDATVEMLGDTYSELVENHAYAVQVAGSEEERFAGTLRQGMTLFDAAAREAGDAKMVPGEIVFKLHDTFGFPRELTKELAEQVGLEVDLDRFEELMSEQRERARATTRTLTTFADAVVVRPTEFVGYEQLSADAVIEFLADPAGREIERAEEGQDVRVWLNRTPFYAESGGQVADTGIITTASGRIRVRDAQWNDPHSIIHSGVIESVVVEKGQEAHAEIDADRRAATARAHTATHVVHWTLRHLLGDHARQAGSLVAPGRLRFDFPHHAALPREELERAEEIANRHLAADDEIVVEHMDFDEAKGRGAIALFGETYGDVVRVISIGDYSTELCGGTHVTRTGNVAVVRLLHEASIGAGMRRVEALVGPDVLREANLERHLLDELTEILKAGDRASLPERARQLARRTKQLETELGRIGRAEVEGLVDQIASRHGVVAGVRLVTSLHDADAGRLRELAQKAVTKLAANGGAAVVLGSSQGGKALLVAAVSKDLVGRGVEAKRLLEPAARAIGGDAGGKPILGFAGGPNGDAVEQAVALIPARLEELLTAGG